MSETPSSPSEPADSPLPRGAGAAAASPAPTEPEPAEDWSTRYKYLLAEFENFRRRAERERENLSQQVRARLLRDLLPIYEGFHFAREAVHRLPTEDPVRRGLDLLHREWQTFLRHEGVEAVAQPGDGFRAEWHEAVGEAASGPDRPDGTITEVVQQGYRFFGGLLRPAKVIVARRPSGTAPAQEATSPEPEPHEGAG